jgi:hypothetical protein
LSQELVFSALQLEKVLMFRAVPILAALLFSQSVYAASLEPQVPPSERAIYADMLKSDPTAAKAYLITREYVSQCRQVVANPALAIDLPDEPDGVDWKYTSSADRIMMKEAIQKALTAYFLKKSGRR